MSLVSTINNIDVWKKHFIDMVNGKKKKQKNVYVVQSGKGESNEKKESIKLVTPTQQVVERAKSDMKRGLEEEGAEMNPVINIKRRRVKKKTIRRKRTKGGKVKKRKPKTKKRKQSKQKSDIFGKY